MPASKRIHDLIDAASGMDADLVARAHAQADWRADLNDPEFATDEQVFRGLWQSARASQIREAKATKWARARAKKESK